MFTRLRGAMQHIYITMPGDQPNAKLSVFNSQASLVFILVPSPKSNSRPVAPQSDALTTPPLGFVSLSLYQYAGLKFSYCRTQRCVCLNFKYYIFKYMVENVMQKCIHFICFRFTLTSYVIFIICNLKYEFSINISPFEKSLYA